MVRRDVLVLPGVSPDYHVPSRFAFTWISGVSPFGLPLTISWSRRLPVKVSTGPAPVISYFTDPVAQNRKRLGVRSN
jgi:hypothetical protein